MPAERTKKNKQRGEAKVKETKGKGQAKGNGGKKASVDDQIKAVSATGATTPKINY